MLEFNYAIRFADGTYYTGKAGDEMQGKRSEAFTYTQNGAYAKIDRLKHSPWFNNATVEQVS